MSRTPLLATLALLSLATLACAGGGDMSVESEEATINIGPDGVEVKTAEGDEVKVKPEGVTIEGEASVKVGPDGVEVKTTGSADAEAPEAEAEAEAPGAEAGSSAELDASSPKKTSKSPIKAGKIKGR